MKVDDIKRIAVIGAGLMGHAIALEFALAGYAVRLNSRTEESVQRGMDQIQETLARLVKLEFVTSEQAASAASMVDPTADLEEAVADADMAVENVYEDLELKRQVFRQLDSLSPQRTILATGTTGLPPTELASATQRPDKVLATHYANPPYLLPFVEIVRGKKTSDHTVSTVFDLLNKIGKRPVIINREVPGFVAMRLQGALLREALSLVQKGIATPEDIDTIIKTGIGRRWPAAGVFEVFDLAGWDVVSAVAAWLFPDLESSPEIPPVLREMVERGELGVKTGKGFYEWTPETAEALRERIGAALAEIQRWDQSD